jgi:hypothetical protein
MPIRCCVAVYGACQLLGKLVFGIVEHAMPCRLIAWGGADRLHIAVLINWVWSLHWWWWSLAYDLRVEPLFDCKWSHRLQVEPSIASGAIYASGADPLGVEPCEWPCEWSHRSIASGAFDCKCCFGVCHCRLQVEPIASGARGRLHCCLIHLQHYAWLANCNSSLPPPLQLNKIVINCSLLA